MPDTLIGRPADDFPVCAIAKAHLDERKAARELDNLRLFWIEADTELVAEPPEFPEAELELFL